MKATGNTIFITGGGSGIGLGLANAFARVGNQVIIAGRREQQLQQAVAQQPGMEYMLLDQGSAADIGRCAATLRESHPELNVLVNNAGIQHVENLASGDLTAAEETFNINLLGPMRITGALLQQLMGRPHATIINVSSALAMMPAAMMPSYCASKAAMHSYTQSLRFQLRHSAVQVIEIIPPWVQTELQGRERGLNPKAMPLTEYIDETWSILREHPEANEIIVERAKAMRFAERSDYDAFYSRYNEGWLESQARA